MDNCRQACPYNTLDGCKVEEYNAICPLTNMAKPITEYKMTNADRIRAMSDEEMAVFLYEWSPSEFCGHVCPRLRDDIPCKGECFEMRKEWLQQPCDVGDNA